MQISQSIHSPLGITVFGSSLIRVSPDIATLNFSVSHLADHPKDAFRLTHERVQAVRNYLSQTQVEEVSTSRIALEESYRNVKGEYKFVGYEAQVQFNVLLKTLDRIKEILVGIIDAGVNKLTDVRYGTTQLRTLRAEARRQAVGAAREKAQIYSEEADVPLGRVLHLEDINPDRLNSLEGLHGRHTEKPMDDEGPLKAFDPGSIVVSGAVMMTFEII
jgi:uncharacterized protein YggE